MKILVTGATGKVGSRFVPRLLAKGYDVNILVRDEAKASDLIALGAKAIIGDLFDAAMLAPAVAGIDAVVHLAALFRVFNDNEGIIKTNHDGTIALANALSQQAYSGSYLSARVTFMVRVMVIRPKRMMLSISTIRGPTLPVRSRRNRNY